MQIVETEDIKTFVAFPFDLYKGEPHFIDVKFMANATIKNDPYWKVNKRALFLAYEGKKVVGRIGAFTNKAHNEHWQDKVGFFGFFECINKKEVAEGLFSVAESWLKKQGCTEMRGPVNPSTNHTCGILIDNFDKDPYIMMPYNFAYYDELIKSCGLEKVKDLVAFERTDKEKMSDRMQKIIARIQKNPSIKMRHINMADFDNEVKRVCEIYNASWTQNWGFVPISKEEIENTAKELRPIVKPELTAVCEINGKVSAFAISVPNMNRVLKEIRTGYSLGNLWRAFRAYRNITDCRMMMLGVHPNHRNRGLELLVVNEVVVKGVESGWNHAELSWLLEDNKGIISVVEETGCYKTKTYRIYQRKIV